MALEFKDGPEQINRTRIIAGQNTDGLYEEVSVRGGELLTKDDQTALMRVLVQNLIKTNETLITQIKKLVYIQSQAHDIEIADDEVS